MKNRRNTRRGRAKRWFSPYPGVWILRGTGWTVLRVFWWDDWQAYDAYAMAECRRDITVFCPSRSAAMRAAEELSRSKK